MTGSFSPPSGDLLIDRGSFAAHRFGRYLVAELRVPHRVLSTSARGGGQREDIRFLANHQSCEATDDRERYHRITSLGPTAYHEEVCREMGVDPGATALMGTAANMAYAVHRAATFDDLRVDAFATAGVAGNAARAGDPAAWTETDDGWQRAAARAGTINTMLLLACPVTVAALARAVVTMTEAKSAALAELAVPSRYSPTIATGTGTDQFCVAAPLDPARPPKTSTGPHAKLGEIIGVAVRDAIKEALRWQNGLEASYTRGLFHALGRFGLTEVRAMERLTNLLPAPRYELLDKNRRAVFYDPGVSAAAHALAAVLDRAAFGTLPAGAANEALRQQAASLASALAARPEKWPAFHADLAGAVDDPVELVLRAVALGWNAKWT
ncbi:MAG: adenosylcobinamide amidohydrolase [Acidobacteria bacterium]|nr:adenosylcobinamide amidohydrolase [Acidobacteriota bacterium]